jgi:hypothetical protein
VRPDNVTAPFAWLAATVRWLREQYPVYDESDLADLEYQDNLEIIADAIPAWLNPDPDGDDESEVPDWITPEQVHAYLWAHELCTDPGRVDYEQVSDAVHAMAADGPDR